MAGLLLELGREHHAHRPGQGPGQAIEAPLVSVREVEELPVGQPLRILEAETEERCKVVMPVLDLLGRRYAVGGSSFPGSSSSSLSIFAMVASSMTRPNGAACSSRRRQIRSEAS